MNQANNRIKEEWRDNLNTALEIFKVVPDAVSKKQITMLVESFIDELLKSQREVYKDALIWCSGSEDFQIEGKAREGWEKICLPLIKE